MRPFCLVRARSTLEQAIADIQEDELVEVTPSAFACKKALNPSFRKRCVKDE